MAISKDAWGRLLLVSYFVIATASGLVFKQQSNCVSEGKKFNHPFMQSMMMYIGEAICMAIFLVYRRVSRVSYEESKEVSRLAGKVLRINPLLLIIPTTCDFISSTLAFFALALMPVSLYSMIRSGNLVITAIATVVILKKRLYRQQLLGLTIIMIGLVTVGLVVINASSSDADSDDKIILGIALLFVSFFAHTAQIIIEEQYFNKYHLNPLQVVGTEGLWGILVCGIGVSIFNFVQCPSAIDDHCAPNGNLEDISFFMDQVFTMSGPDNDTPDQPMLLIMAILGVFVILLLNAASVSITKYVSSLARNVAQVLAPFFIWMASLALGWQSFLVGQLLGFLVIAFGTCLFNELIVLPFAGFNVNTKKNIAARDKKKQLLESNDSASLIQGEQ